MAVDLQLTVLREARRDAGSIAAVAVTEELLFAVGQSGAVLASSNARHFEPRNTPGTGDLHGVLADGDTIAVCGDGGLLAVSRDRGGTWAAFDTNTTQTLRGLAASEDGTLWIAGDGGFAARAGGRALEPIELETTADLTGVCPMRDELAWLGSDGKIYRWRDGDTIPIATGATGALRGLVLTRAGTWIAVGSGGFIARSPDGAWFTRIKSGLVADLEAVTVAGDGSLVAVGDGFVVMSRDDGRTWKAVVTGADAHFRSCGPFGDGVVIGGDHGIIVKLAPDEDDPWADRVDVFGSVRRPLDATFADGPDGFIDAGLTAHVQAFGLEKMGSAISGAAFETTYGAAMPAEAARLFELIGGGVDAFEQLTVTPAVVPAVSDANLFERLVEHDQGARDGTSLVEAFCGLFPVGALHNGDRVLMELYEWDGRRQILHYGHGEHAFSGVFADSLDTLVYYTALEKAHGTGLVSDETYMLGLRKLRGRIAPTRELAILERDPEFTLLDARRRDTEFLFYRARWIVMLLANDSADANEIKQAFNADFNQIVPAHQLPARLEACEKLNPTALYAMWRAYFFDEPELVRYLEVGRRHRARIVRDAAALIDELRSGRNQLGVIDDMRAHVERFRALDLDPRRAEARRAEAEARGRIESGRRLEVEAELERAPHAVWPELAWRWLDDGIAHRVLLARLDERTDTAAQIAAIDELRMVGDADRGLILPRLARELMGELEAVLVGSVVRGDALEDALARPRGEGEDDDEDDDDDDEDDEDFAEEPDLDEEPQDEPDDADLDDDVSPAHEAIDRMLEPLYHGVDPHRFYAPFLPARFGGDEPLDAVAVYLREEPVPHFHFVTYGLFADFGFELTMRLTREARDEEVPEWTVLLLQTLARYVFSTGNRFDVGHKMGLGEPIDPNRDTEISALLFARDPELALLQVVGITGDEYALIQEWATAGLVEILSSRLPMLVTDLARASVLADPRTAADVRARVDVEGSSEDLTYVEELLLAVRADGTILVEVAEMFVSALPRAMRSRLRLGRPYSLRGRGHVLHLAAGEKNAHLLADGELTLTLSPETQREIEMRFEAAAPGRHRLETWPAIQIGVRAEETEAPQVLYGAPDEDEHDDGHDHHHDDEHFDDEGSERTPRQILAALAMSQRAFELSADDEEIQFTHAMLLVEAERAGVAGQGDELMSLLGRVSVGNRLLLLLELGRDDSEMFEAALEAALDGLAELPVPSGEYADALDELLGDLAEIVIAHAPEQLGLLVPVLPPRVPLLATLAWRAVQAGERDAALALYERLLGLPIPSAGAERAEYLRAMNNACVQAHAAQAYELAVRIADRAQPVARENPYLFHSAACAYAAVGDRAKAIDMVRFAIDAGYEHIEKLASDPDLGDLRRAPEVLALFRAWRAGEGKRG